MAEAQLLTVLFVFLAFLSVATSVRGSTGSYTDAPDDVFDDRVQAGVHVSAEGDRRDAGRDQPSAGTPQRTMKELGGYNSRNQERSWATSTPGKWYRVSLSSRPRRATLKLLRHVASVFAVTFILASIFAMCFKIDGGPKRAGVARRSLSEVPQHEQIELCSLIDADASAGNGGLVSGRVFGGGAIFGFDLRSWWKRDPWFFAEVLTVLIAVAGAAVIIEGLVKRFSPSPANLGNSSGMAYTNGSIRADNATGDGIVAAERGGQQLNSLSTKTKDTLHTLETGNKSTSPSVDPLTAGHRPASSVTKANNTMGANKSTSDGGVSFQTSPSVGGSAGLEESNLSLVTGLAATPANGTTKAPSLRAQATARSSDGGWKHIAVTGTFSCKERFSRHDRSCHVSFFGQEGALLQRAPHGPVECYFDFPSSFFFTETPTMRNFMTSAATSVYFDWREKNFTSPYSSAKVFQVPVPANFSLPTSPPTNSPK